MLLLLSRGYEESKKLKKELKKNENIRNCYRDFKSKMLKGLLHCRHYRGHDGIWECYLRAGYRAFLEEPVGGGPLLLLCIEDHDIHKRKKH